MALSAAQLGFIRGISFTILMAVLTFFADAANLNGLVGPVTASVVASIALAIENHFAAKGKNALFGAVAQK